MAEKKGLEKQKGKKNKGLDDNQRIEIAKAVITAKERDGQLKGAQKFSIARIFAISIEEASKLAEISLSWAYVLNADLQKNPKSAETLFQECADLMPPLYRAWAKLQLPRIARIEERAMAEYEKDPKLLIRSPQLAKQWKQTGGVSPADEAPVQQTSVHIEQLRALIIGAVPDAIAQKFPDKAITVEAKALPSTAEGEDEGD